MPVGYCVRCKGRKEISNPQQKTYRNGKLGLEGTCPDCGARIRKFIGGSKGNPSSSGRGNKGVEETGKSAKKGEGGTEKSEETQPTPPSGDGGEEIAQTEEEPETAEVPTSKTREVADDFGVWRRLYIPYDVGFAFNRAKAEGLTKANDLQSWLVECVELALEYAYGWRIVFEKVTSEDGKMEFLRNKNLSQEELSGLLKTGTITQEEFEKLVGGNGWQKQEG